jgi:hypothetical protein
MPKFNLYYPSEKYLSRWRKAARAEGRSLSQFIRLVVDRYINERDTGDE